MRDQKKDIENQNLEKGNNSNNKNELQIVEQDRDIQLNFSVLRNMKKSIIFSLFIVYSGTFLITMPKGTIGIENNNGMNYHGIIILVYIFCISFFAIIRLYPSKSGVENEIECVIKLGNLQKGVSSSTKKSSHQELKCFVKEQGEAPALELLFYWTIWILYGVICSTFLNKYGYDIKIIVISSVFLVISVYLAYDKKMLTNKIHFFVNLFIFNSNIFLLSILSIPYYSIYYSEEIYLVFVKVTVFILLYFLNHVTWSNIKRDYIKKNDGIQMKSENCILIDRGSIYHSVIISASIKFIQSSWVLYAYKYTLLVSFLQIIYLSKFIIFGNRTPVSSNTITTSATQNKSTHQESNTNSSSDSGASSSGGSTNVKKLARSQSKTSVLKTSKSSKSETKKSTILPSTQSSTEISSVTKSKKKEDSNKKSNNSKREKNDTVIDINTRDGDNDGVSISDEESLVNKNKKGSSGKNSFFGNKYKHLFDASTFTTNSSNKDDENNSSSE